MPRKVLMLAVAAAFVFVACGDDEPSTPTTTEPPSTYPIPGTTGTTPGTVPGTVPGSVPGTVPAAEQPTVTLPAP